VFPPAPGRPPSPRATSAHEHDVLGDSGEL